MADHAGPGRSAGRRGRVAREGWGARLLDLQRPDGAWIDATYTKFIDTPDGSALYALVLLRDMGLDPASAQARCAVARVRDNVTFYAGGKPFFAGETEPCINGRVLGLGAYFGEPSEDVLERLLGEQLDDGGWNCEAPPSVRSSFHTTICVLEGLLEWERVMGATAMVTEAQTRGQAYLLDRSMFRSLSSGQVIDPDWTAFSYPPWWHYDVLRGLDYLRRAGVEPDDRIDETIELLKGSRLSDGRWPLQNPHADRLEFGIEEPPGEPSRWNTLRAMRVLDWADRSG